MNLIFVVAFEITLIILIEEMKKAFRQINIFQDDI